METGNKAEGAMYNERTNAVRFAFAVLLAAAILSVGTRARSQIAPALGSPSPRQDWTALWISHPSAPLRDPIVLHFRRSFQPVPGTRHFVIHVSADNRFLLFLNGRRVGEGPARGDLAHWRYETFDLGPLLTPGENILSASVWNFGVYAPTAQMSDRTAFLVQGDTPAESIVDTNDKWRVMVERGHLVYPRQPRGFWVYTASGPGEKLVAADYDWSWQTEDTSSGGWVAAATAIRESIYPQSGIAASRGHTSGTDWALVPDTLPPMTYLPTEAGKLVRSDLPGVSTFKSGPITIPAHSHGHLLFARPTLTTAYPRLTFSGGKRASIELTYSEALYDAQQKKGDRDEIGSRQALGVKDLVLADGGRGRSFEPLWWRAWRYIDLEIATGEEPLSLDSFTASYTAYPFRQIAAFESSDPELNKIWKIGWRTVELDAHETYMDTPYYEQLQYVGDSRIEAMISYAVTGDPRLAAQTIRAIDDSRTPDGLTASRYPSSLPQRIPPFSLLWIGMLHDFALYNRDPGLIAETLPGTRAVLTWFARYQQANGLLSRLPDWSFVDWTEQDRPMPTYDSQGQSCLLTLQYIGALEEARDLERGFGDATLAQDYGRRIASGTAGVMDRCWNAKAGLLADSPARDVYSEHSNALGVLYDVVPKARQREVMTRLLDAHDGKAPEAPVLTPASYYFKFYIARALDHAGMGDRYFALLEAWRKLLPLHFTTWPETPGDTRSDSHAWSADPTYDLLTIVAGIRPDGFGFKDVLIEPHLGSLTDLDASVAHDGGPIHVHYRVAAGRLDATVTLPPGLSGTFTWQGKSLPVHPGENTLQLEKAHENR